jgi:hypothetical protein
MVHEFDERRICTHFMAFAWVLYTLYIVIALFPSLT